MKTPNLFQTRFLQNTYEKAYLGIFFGVKCGVKNVNENQFLQDEIQIIILCPKSTTIN